MARPKGVRSSAVAANPGRLVFVAGLLAKDEAGEIFGASDITAQHRASRSVCIFDAEGSIHEF